MRKRAGRLFANGAVRFAVVFLTLSAVAAPSLGFWFSLEPDRDIAAQIDRAAVSPPGEYVEALERLRFENSVPILTYHGIDENDTRYSVSPDAFNMQMAALAAAGFHTITSQQFVGFLRGTDELPEKPILLTFDDNVKSVWINADPILKLYGFHGVVFTITGRVGAHQPYYMTWQEIERMAASGRWDFESHTRFGHSRVKAGAGDRVGAFLTNKEWLETAGRLETLDEYTAASRERSRWIG